jgi:hypothetical protein
MSKQLISAAIATAIGTGSAFAADLLAKALPLAPAAVTQLALDPASLRDLIDFA